MQLRLHLVIYLRNDALWVDEKGSAARAHIRPPHKLLLAKDAIAPDNFFMFVSKERKREFVSARKLLMACNRVGRDTEHHRTYRGEVRKLIAYRTCFYCTTWRIVLRIEIE